MAIQAQFKLQPAAWMPCFKIGPKIGKVKFDEPGLTESVQGYVRVASTGGAARCTNDGADDSPGVGE